MRPPCTAEHDLYVFDLDLADLRGGDGERSEKKAVGEHGFLSYYVWDRGRRADVAGLGFGVGLGGVAAEDPGTRPRLRRIQFLGAPPVNPCSARGRLSAGAARVCLPLAAWGARWLGWWRAGGGGLGTLGGDDSWLRRTGRRAGGPTGAPQAGMAGRLVVGRPARGWGRARGAGWGEERLADAGAGAIA